jgi:membrane-associated phospholipid phosphatase
MLSVKCVKFACLLLVLNAGSARRLLGQNPADSTSAAQLCSSFNVTEEQSTGWGQIVPDVIKDQKRIYVSFPNEVIHGKHWKAVAGVLGVTAALIAADQYDTPYFRRTSSFKTFNSALSGTNTSLAIVAAPVAVYAAGLITKDPYAASTGILSGEAVLDSEILGTLMKIATARKRPTAISSTGNFSDSFSDGKGFSGSFPSGHTFAAFSVATVISRRYGAHRRWLPLVSYGLATVIGFSRVSLSDHFPSDVFFGAVIGYSVGRFVVVQR